MKNTIKIANRFICSSDILYIESDGSYANVYYRFGWLTISTLMAYSISHYERQLPNMVRIHRSYLVNPNHIRRWEGEKLSTCVLEMANGEDVPVSKHRLVGVKLHSASLADVLNACRAYGKKQ